MPKFLFQSWYTTEGARGLVKDGGTGRRNAIDDAVKKLGGKLEACYFAFGEVDGYIIVDLPDATAAAALALAVNQSGMAKVRTTVLMTPQDLDQAAKKPVDYRPPGR